MGTPGAHPTLLDRGSLSRAGAQRRGRAGCERWDRPSVLTAGPCSESPSKSTTVGPGSRMRPPVVPRAWSSWLCLETLPSGGSP